MRKKCCKIESSPITVADNLSVLLANSHYTQSASNSRTRQSPSFE